MEGATAPTPETEPIGEGDLAAARVLIVDDDERNAFAAVQALEDLGHTLVVARSGEEALRALLHDDFAVILLDLHMPGMDGYETARLIRARRRNATTPIVFLTAIFRDEAHVFQAYSAGAVDVVFKPVDPFILRSKVTVLVDLYLKTEAIKRKEAEARRLLAENARMMAEKAKAERALERSRQREETILRSLPVVFHSRSATPPFAPSFVSDSIAEITGFAADRFVADPEFGSSRIHPEDLPRVVEAHASATRHGAYSVEFRWLCEDGQYRYLLDQGVLAPGATQEQPEIFGVIIDATERRSLEEQLAQARKMEAVGQLTGGVAHDFNNLLTVVLGNVDMLTHRAEDEAKRARRIDAVRQAAERGRDLTQQLLAFSRRQHLTPVTLDVRALIEDFTSLIRQAVGEAVSVEVVGPDTPLPVHVDRTQLETALLNLAVNARDAMPEGGALIIESRLDEAERMVVIEVRDTGVGMSPEVSSRVFEPFFTTKDVGKGSGLGLSQVYGFVNQSHGKVGVISELGRGTAISLHLPLASGDVVRADRRVPSEEPLGGSERLLLVEDEATVRELSVEMLRSLGYEVLTAATAGEAMAILESDPQIDLLFSDVVMPGGVNGVGLARAARQLRPDLPVLLTSGFVADQASRDKSEFPLIDKPYEVSSLSRALRELLDAPAAQPVRTAQASRRDAAAVARAGP